MPEPSSSSPADPALESLALRYLDRQLGDDELSALNARLAASPAERDAFVQVCTQSWELREMLKTRLATAEAGASLLDDADDGAVTGERSGMNESMVLPAVHEADLAATDEPEPTEVMRFPRVADRQERTLRGLARRFGWVAAAAVIAIGLSVWWIARAGPAATLAGAVEARWESSGSLDVGAMLRSGQPVRLMSGLAELAFDNGVRVILEGPAEITPIDGRNATLAYGKLRARVPHGAEGFRVGGAGLMVTDLGTEFGMSIAAAGAVAEVHVFDGKVEVGLPAPKDEAQRAAAGATATMMRLSRDEALRCQPAPGGVASVERIPSRTESFVQDIHRPRVPIPLRASGAGLAIGQPDPLWTIAADQGDDTFAPQPAYVARVDSNVHRANDPQTSQWLSNAGDFPPMPKVASYRFRARIDLTGFDPSTVVLRARVVMDDELLDVRVNGSSARQSLPYRELQSRQNFGEVVLDRGFTEGLNDVDFVVKNVQAMSQLGVRVEWSASGLKAK